MDQTGDGALRQYELSALQTGFLVPLPHDREGCPVLFIDGHRCGGRRFTEKGRDRCLFYILSVLSENEKSRSSGGIVILINATGTEALDLKLLEQLSMAMPLCFKAVHILSLGSTTGVSVSLRSSFRFADQTHIHTANTRKQMAEKLYAFGLKDTSIPRDFGGKYGYAKFVQWKELRARMEWKVPLGLSGRHVDVSEIPGMKAYESIVDKTERNRRLNAIHSRRKRDRSHVEQRMAEEERMCSQEEATELASESEGQDGIVARARRLIGGVGERSVDGVFSAVGGLLALGSPSPSPER